MRRIEDIDGWMERGREGDGKATGTGKRKASG
jgi:hypothetical protein